MKILVAIALSFGVSQVMAQQEIDSLPQQQEVNLPDSSQQEIALGSDPQNASAYDTTGQDLLMDTIPVTDGFYQANNLEDAVPFAYPKINMKNIRFYKRVWRDIDLSNEENYIYAIPGASLMEAIMQGINEGKLTPYSAEDDAFETKMTAREGTARFADSVLVPIFDDEGNQIDAQMTLNEFNPASVTKFRIKEDIFFDKQRGRLETRIIGVAPLMDISTSAELAESVGSTPAFWLYFPQLRYALVKVDVSDPDRGIYDMSMDDLFVQRKFASTIVRESSPSAMRQQQLEYADGQLQQTPTPQTPQTEEKLEAYKAKLWSAPKGIDPKELENYQEPQQGQAPVSGASATNTSVNEETPVTELEETGEVPAEISEPTGENLEQQQQSTEETEGWE